MKKAHSFSGKSMKCMLDFFADDPSCGQMIPNGEESDEEESSAEDEATTDNIFKNKELPRAKNPGIKKKGTKGAAKMWTELKKKAVINHLSNFIALKKGTGN